MSESYYCWHESEEGGKTIGGIDHLDAADGYARSCDFGEGDDYDQMRVSGRRVYVRKPNGDVVAVRVRVHRSLFYDATEEL